MTEAGLAIAAGCALQVVEAALTPSETHWRETLHVEVVAEPSCGWVALAVPPGAEIVQRTGRSQLGDGGRRRLGDERWMLSDPDRDGARTLRVYLPDLLGGDRAVLDVVRRLPAGPVAWRPGAAGFWLVEAPAAVTLEVPEQVTRDPSENRVWTADAPASLTARLSSSLQVEATRPEALPAALGVRVSERLTLTVPPGDPQIRMFPGGGSEVQRELVAEFPPTEVAHAWRLPAPPDAEIRLRVEPADTAELLRDTGVPRIRIAPTEASVRVTASWVEPDAPSFGERAADRASLTVHAEGGDIEWEGDVWRLVQMHGRPIMPQRAALERALDNRFRRAALPEPGSPNSLRGRTAGWDLAAALKPALLERVAIATWPSDALWPRKLARARRTGALTPTEAALTVWLYGRQQDLDVDWALVRPAPRGPGAKHAPAGFTAALVRVTIDNESRWIDPSCAVCGDFELPPDLTGAATLGVSGGTPAPVPGSHLAVVGDARVEWRLSGVPALMLRMWLQEVAPAARTEALAERIGGVGAKVLVVEGIAEAGAPVRVVTTRGSSPVADPLALPDPGDADAVWIPWVGERRVTWPMHDIPDASASAGPVSWNRTHGANGITERLEITERDVSADAIRSIQAARR